MLYLIKFHNIELIRYTEKRLQWFRTVLAEFKKFQLDSNGIFQNGPTYLHSMAPLSTTELNNEGSNDDDDNDDDQSNNICHWSARFIWSKKIFQKSVLQVCPNHRAAIHNIIKIFFPAINCKSRRWQLYLNSRIRPLSSI